MDAGTARGRRQGGAGLGGGAAQEIGRLLRLGVELKHLLDGGEQVGVGGALLVQEDAALLRVQVEGLLEQGFHHFGRGFRHGASVEVDGRG
jgi:hypothetical protein